MSRIISAGRNLRPVQPCASGGENILPSLRATCMATHQKCLAAVTRSLENEISQFAEPSERMALLLACAQHCHSTAALIQTQSRHIGRLAAICAELCLLCADACAAPELPKEFLACAQACRKCADQCFEALRSMPLL